MQEEPARDSMSRSGEAERREPDAESPLGPVQVTQELERIAAHFDIQYHLLSGSKTGATLRDGWPRAACVALFEAFPSQKFSISYITQKTLPLTHFGVVLNPTSLREKLRKFPDARACAASLYDEKNWPKESLRARGELVALARDVVASVVLGAHRELGDATKEQDAWEHGEFRETLSAIAGRHSIAIGRITGPRDKSSLRFGWPRALLAAVLERMGTLPPVLQFQRVIVDMGKFDVVFDGISIRHYVTASGGVAGAAARLENAETWPFSSQSSREDLLRLARRFAAEIAP